MGPTHMTVFTRTRWAIGLSAVLTGTAMLLYPGGTPLDHSTIGYSMFRNFLSDLGCTVAFGGRSNVPGAVLFVASLGLLVVALGRCMVEFIRLFSRSRVARSLAWVAGAVGVLGAAAFIGVALTPENRFMALHIQCTVLGFRCLPVVSLLFALASAQNENFPRRTVIAWLVLTALLVVHVAVMEWGPSLTTDRGLAIQVTEQKIIVLAILAILLYQTHEADRVRVGEVSFQASNAPRVHRP